MRARLKKREKSAMTNLISLVVGSRGNKGMSRRREAVNLLSTVGVLLYLHTHQQKLQIYTAQTHTYTVHTPLANYPPATAFAVEWHGLTHHHQSLPLM